MNINDLISENFSDDDIKRELKVPSDFRLKGYVYVLSNESMPGIYKVGMTERSVEERAKELSKMTASPTPFKIEACFYSQSPLSDEREIHELLSRYRVSESREFFKCSLEKITLAVREILSLERNDELTDVAACYDALCLGGVSDDLIIEDELNLSYYGNRSQLDNLLIKIGEKVLSELLKKHSATIVLMPNKSIELIRSIDEQFNKGEAK